jgi:hypothetical protein
MTTTTTTTACINLDQLGDSATLYALTSFIEAFSNACDEDDRVHWYNAHRVGNIACLTVTGTVSAHDLSDEVYEGKHGAW